MSQAVGGQRKDAGRRRRNSAIAVQTEHLEQRTLLSGALTFDAPLGTSADALLLRVNGGSVEVDENGVAVASQDLASTTAVVINAASRATNLTVDFGGDALDLSVAFNGMSGQLNSMTLQDGSFGQETTTLTPTNGGTVALDTATVTFANVPALTDTSTATSYELDLPTLSQWQWVTADSAPGSAVPTLSISDRDHHFSTTSFANKHMASVGLSSLGNDFTLDTTVAPAGLSALMIAGATGDTDVHVFHLAVPTTFTAQQGYNQVYLPENPETSHFISPLTIIGPTNANWHTSVEAWEPTDSVGRPITVSPSGITGAGSTPVNFGGGTLGTVILHTNDGPNAVKIPDLQGNVQLTFGSQYVSQLRPDQTVNVTATQPGSSLTLSPYWLTLDLNLGSGGNSQQVGGDITLYGSAGSQVHCVIDDSADPTPRQAMLTEPLTGIIPGRVLWSWNQPVSVTVNGGGGGDAYDIFPLFSSAFVVNGGPGNDTFLVRGSPARINGGGGDDQLTVVYNGTLQYEYVSFDGGPGINSVEFDTAPGLQLNVGAAEATAGTNTFAFSNISSLTLTGGGAYASAADLGGAGRIAVDGGSTLTAAVAQNLVALEIGAASSVIIARADPGTAATLSTASLQIDSAGKLDLRSDTLHVHYPQGQDPVDRVRGWVAGGYNGGDWRGAGITSTSAGTSYGLAVTDSADGATGGGGANTVVVRRALKGDVDLDGSVSFADLLTLAQGYRRQTADWDQGDFNYDGTVGFADLLLLAQNYGKSDPGTIATAATPASTSTGSNATVRRRLIHHRALPRPEPL